MDKNIELGNFEPRFPKLEVQLSKYEHRLAEIKLRFSAKLIEMKERSSSYAGLTKKDFKLRMAKKQLELEKRNLSYDELLKFTASLVVKNEANDLESQVRNSQSNARDLMIEGLELCVEAQQQAINLVKKASGHMFEMQNELVVLKKNKQKMQATKAVNARHDKPGGSREKQKAIRDIWATGKYTSRDICADEEYAALSASRKTVRNALIGTPNPNPWPAREQSKRL